MSLIQQALEKTGKIKKIEEEICNPPAVNPAPFNLHEKSQKLLKRSPVTLHLPPFPKWRNFRVPKISARVALWIGGFILLAALSHFFTTRQGSATYLSSTASLEKGVTPLPSNPHKEKFRLTGVTTSGGETFALINNQVVKVGDRLREGLMVAEITNKGAVLELNGRRTHLSL